MSHHLQEDRVAGMQTDLDESGGDRRGGLCKTQFEEVEGSDSFECRGVGAFRSTVVGVHAAPGLEVSNCSFDDVPNLVDRGIELLLPVEEFATGGSAIRDSDAGAEVAFVA